MAGAEIEGNEGGFEWPTATASSYAPIYRDLRCGTIIRRIVLSDIKQIIGEITIYLERRDIVIALDCEIYTIEDRVAVDLCYVSLQDVMISVAAESGENIEQILQYYINQGVIRLMIAKSGVFWVQKKIRQTNNPG